MFRNREDAARQLARRLKERPWHDPLILGIPRGGVVIGAILAQELAGELDVVLSRKLRAPRMPELAIGAVSEEGEVLLNSYAQEILEPHDRYLANETRHQLTEIARRQSLFRDVRPRARVTGRSVIVTDDGIATGSTMIAALDTVRKQNPLELIVAVPVASPDTLEAVSAHCDDVFCLSAPRHFRAIGQFYRDFQQIEDEQVVALLRPVQPMNNTLKEAI